MTELRKEVAEKIDKFVDFFILNNCGGCTECEPRLSSDWFPNMACCEEGRAKWFLQMSEEFKKQEGLE